MVPQGQLNFLLPDEESEFKIAANAGAFKNAIWDFDQDLRGKAKHGEDIPITPSAVRKMLYDFLQGHGVALE